VNDQELIARAREVSLALRASTGERTRLAGWLLKELADREAAPRLTDADREVIRRVSLLTGLRLIDGLREHTGQQDVTQAFIDGWEEAMDLLRRQAAVIARLDRDG